MTQQVISPTADPRKAIASEARRRVEVAQRAGEITPEQALKFRAEIRKVQFGQEEPKHLEQFGLRDASEPQGAIAQIQARQAEIDRIAQQIKSNDQRQGKQPDALKAETLASGVKLRETLQAAGEGVADALIPGLWARNFDQLSNTERITNAALDALFLVPIVGAVGRATIKGSRAALKTGARQAIDAVPRASQAERANLTRSVDFNVDRLDRAIMKGDANAIRQTARTLEQDFRNIGLRDSSRRFSSLADDADKIAVRIQRKQAETAARKASRPDPTTGRREVEAFQIRPQQSIAQRIEKDIQEVVNPFANLSPEVAAARKANLDKILKSASKKIESSQKERARKTFERATRDKEPPPPPRTRREIRESQRPKKVTPEELQALRERGRKTKVATKEGVKLTELEEALKRPPQRRVSREEFRREAERQQQQRLKGSERQRDIDVERARTERQRQLRQEFEKRQAQKERFATDKARREASERRIQELRARRRERQRELEEQAKPSERKVARQLEKTAKKTGAKKTPKTKRRTPVSPLPKRIPDDAPEDDPDATPADRPDDRPTDKPKKGPAERPGDDPEDKPDDKVVPVPKDTPDDDPDDDPAPDRPTPDPDDDPTTDDDTKDDPKKKPDDDDPDPDPDRTPTGKPGRPRPSPRRPRLDDADRPRKIRDISGQSADLPVNVVAFRQGAVWYEADLTTGKEKAMGDPPAGLPDTGTPQESLTILQRGTKRPTQRSIDMGVVTATLGRRGRSIRFEA